MKPLYESILSIDDLEQDIQNNAARDALISRGFTIKEFRGGKDIHISAPEDKLIELNDEIFNFLRDGYPNAKRWDFKGEDVLIDCFNFENITLVPDDIAGISFTMVDVIRNCKILGSAWVWHDHKLVIEKCRIMGKLDFSNAVKIRTFTPLSWKNDIQIKNSSIDKLRLYWVDYVNFLKQLNDSFDPLKYFNLDGNKILEFQIIDNKCAAVVINQLADRSYINDYTDYYKRIKLSGPWYAHILKYVRNRRTFLKRYESII